MTRDQIIQILVEERLTEWVYANNTVPLDDILYYGCKSYDNYTDDELKKEIDEFDEEMIKEYQLSIERRLTAERENKGVANSNPF